MTSYHIKPKLLFLYSGPISPEDLPVQEKFKALSKVLSGAIIAPVYGRTNTDQIGDFQLITFIYWQRGSIARNLIHLVRTLKIGMEIRKRHDRFDAIVSTNPLVSALAARLLARIMDAKLVIEVNGNFESAFLFGREGQIKSTLMDNLKAKLSRNLIPLNLARADAIKQVYSSQLHQFGIDASQKRVFTFPNFVPIHRFFDAAKSDGRYILLVGFPWYLKGVDLLIRAFQAIAPDFPNYRLKIVGWCPDGRDYYENLAGADPKIELSDSVPYENVIELMANCSIYVLASRTDASPRVLREAMACGKPIIASNTNGVPELITHRFNGLLFKNGDVEDLVTQLRALLSNRSLASRLGVNGLRFVQSNLSESVYVYKYREMIDALIEDRLATQVP